MLIGGGFRGNEKKLSPEGRNKLPKLYGRLFDAFDRDKPGRDADHDDFLLQHAGLEQTEETEVAPPGIFLQHQLDEFRSLGRVEALHHRALLPRERLVHPRDGQSELRLKKRPVLLRGRIGQRQGNADPQYACQNGEIRVTHVAPCLRAGRTGAPRIMPPDPDRVKAR